MFLTISFENVFKNKNKGKRKKKKKKKIYN
jgi:hypothetical protein